MHKARSRYLRELHTKSDKHKKRFAFAVSSVATLMIFSVWSFVRYAAPINTAGTTPTQNNAAVLLAVDNGDGTQTVGDVGSTVEGPTPFQNFESGLGASLAALKNSFSGVKKSAATLENQVNDQYSDVRADTLNSNVNNN